MELVLVFWLAHGVGFFKILPAEEIGACLKSLQTYSFSSVFSFNEHEISFSLRECRKKKSQFICVEKNNAKQTKNPPKNKAKL